jgi:molybdopterin/thiamine biosynthesis adenylyltransferase
MTGLTDDEKTRYHRQLIIPSVGTAGQEKISKARVLVVGAGGLGSPLLMYLAAAGVGTIGIIDPDVVTVDNLQRQIIYTTRDIGLPKAATAAEHISMLNPLIKVQPYITAFTEVNAASLLSGYDVTADCSDNYTTRYLLSDVTRNAGIPLVYGAVHQFMGQVSVFNYKGGPSYRTLFPEEMSASDDNETDPPGIIGPLPGIIGSVQACEIIKIIIGAENILAGRLLQIDAMNLRAEIIEL